MKRKNISADTALLEVARRHNTTRYLERAATTANNKIKTYFNL